MLNPLVVAEVERLLKEGKLSWRKIAARSGVSRGSVHAIAHGRRSAGQSRQREFSSSARSGPSEFGFRGDQPGGEFALGFEGPIGRCGECGRRMVLPCRACHITRMKELGLIKRPTRRRA